MVAVLLVVRAASIQGNQAQRLGILLARDISVPNLHRPGVAIRLKEKRMLQSDLNHQASLLAYCNVQ